jgi:predicted RecB family nuclease
MIISTPSFEAYLKCPSKCWFLFLDKKGDANIYSDFLRKRNNAYRAAGIERLMAKIQPGECVVKPSIPVNIKTATWLLAIDLVARKETFESCLHAVERIPTDGQSKPAQFIPIRFIFTNKVTKDDKLVLAFDALALSETLRMEVSHGKIVYGKGCNSAKIKTSILAGDVRKITGRIIKLIANESPPDLVLNRYCAECEYQVGCRQMSIEQDDLSLLAGMSAKERKKFNSKGIFTVTQLSCTFRPRRRPKRRRDKREKYHHSLKALAIREKKIHIVGSPAIKIEGTPVYLDVEGLPDLDFYYLIGIRIQNGESVVQHSLWADSLEDEKTIWNEFIEILSTIEDPVLIHYGSFETAFLKRMCERYGELIEGTAVQKSIKESLNLLTVTYAQIYFPEFSNGLKDTAGFLGFNWTETDCAGLFSIAWRHFWEDMHDKSIKEKLIRYNAQDCEALELLTETIQQIGDHIKTDPINHRGESSIVYADSDRFPQKSKWQAFKSPVSSLEYINTAAQWNYQRDRVYARSGQVKQKLKQQRKQPRSVIRVDKIINWERSRICPVCNRSYYFKGPERTKTFHEILFGNRSLKLRYVKYVFTTYICRKCSEPFGMPDKFQHIHKYGLNIVAYFFYQIVELCIPQRTVVENFNRLFGFQLHRSTLYNLKMRIADYYKETKQQILERIVHSDVVHADETRANIKGKAAFVWVLTSFHEVFYFFAESREGEIAQKLLANFKGVLVSDFYTAYDSIGCLQQKCLIHLMRDLNDEILNSPFDEQLKQIVIEFGNLLKPMIETVDRHGLKKYFLNKHLSRVDRFYRHLEFSDYQSEVALKCKDRLERNRYTLFTFLNYDGVPWNNNNAEHAVKAFARLRDVIAGTSTERGTDEYLTFLSICQTCKYSGLDFLDFLRTGEKNIDRFLATKKKRLVSV